jgi:transcriptional regulator with XRE-family HTH domain
MSSRISSRVARRRHERLGANIRQLREAAGETQTAAAAAMGLNRGFLRGVEAGERNVSVERLFDIADHFEVTVAALLDGVT